ncbi:MAG: hypothetical protein IJI68_11685, partial [Eggerthellaceae bacterium]|nr:hypothetical protein [Eggerthellaceae bacterium]
MRSGTKPLHPANPRPCPNGAGCQSPSRGAKALTAYDGIPARQNLHCICKHLDEANLAIAEAVQAPASDLLDATRTLHSLFEATKLIIDGSDESYV